MKQLIDNIPSLVLLKKRLEQATLPVIALIGKDAYLQRSALEIIDKILQPNDWNKEQFLGDSVRSEQLNMALLQIPVMSKTRLVILKRAEDAPKELLAELVDYLDQPNATTCFVITAENPDLRTKFFSTLNEKSFYVDVEPISGQKLPKFIQYLAKSYGLELERGVDEFLAEETRGDLDALTLAIQKCVSYVAPAREINLEQAALVLGIHAEQSVFDLIDAIFEGDVVNAAMLVYRLRGQPVLRTLALIARQVRLLVVVVDMMTSQRQLVPSKLALALKIQPFVVGKLLQQGKRLSVEQVTWMHGFVYQVEQRIRSVSIEPELLLEHLVLEITGRIKTG